MYASGKRVMWSVNRCIQHNFTRNVQVSIIGASKPMAQSISLLLKQNPSIHRLTMYGPSKETYGVALDVAHIPREATVQGWTGRMEYALKGSDIVIVACGEPKRESDTETHHFHKNADAVIQAMTSIAKYCPHAFILVATDPLNKVFPLACKVLQSCNCYNKQKVLGVAGLYTMRAQTCVGGMYDMPAHTLKIPVICGHSPDTVVPLFSHIAPWFQMDNSTACALTEVVKGVDDQVAKLKRGNGESTLSYAHATFNLVTAVVNCIQSNTTSENTAFIENDMYGTKYFASPVIITKHGISAVREYPTVTKLEGDYLYMSSQKLIRDVKEGEAFLHETSKKKKKISKEIISKCTY